MKGLAEIGARERFVCSDHFKAALKARGPSYENTDRRGARSCVCVCIQIGKHLAKRRQFGVLLFKSGRVTLPSIFQSFRFKDGAHCPLKSHNHRGTPCPLGVLSKLVVTLTDRQIHSTRLTSGGFAVWTNHLARSCKVTRTVGDEELRLKSLIQSCSSKLKIHLNPLKSYRKFDSTCSRHVGASQCKRCFLFCFFSLQTANLT